MLYVDFFSYISGEFQVLSSVGARFNGSNLLKRAIVAYPLLKSGQFRLLGINTICSHCLDYCTCMGMVYLKGVGFCLLSSSR